MLQIVALRVCLLLSRSVRNNNSRRNDFIRLRCFCLSFSSSFYSSPIANPLQYSNLSCSLQIIPQPHPPSPKSVLGASCLAYKSRLLHPVLTNFSFHCFQGSFICHCAPTVNASIIFFFFYSRFHIRTIRCSTRKTSKILFSLTYVIFYESDFTVFLVRVYKHFSLILCKCR